MRDFANLVDGGRQLGPLLVAALAGHDDPILLPVMPNGIPVALGVVEANPWPIQSLPVQRSDEGAVIARQQGLAGRTVVVIDDGIETGTVARASAAALRESGVGVLVLAVPVCPRDAMADLQHHFDLVVAVAQPTTRRELAGHYDDFDTIDDATARRLLWDHNAGG